MPREISRNTLIYCVNLRPNLLEISDFGKISLLIPVEQGIYARDSFADDCAHHHFYLTAIRFTRAIV